jgi:hypothetical protein
VLEEIQECAEGEVRIILEISYVCAGGNLGVCWREVCEFTEGEVRIILEESYLCAGGNLGVCWRKV